MLRQDLQVHHCAVYLQQYSAQCVLLSPVFSADVLVLLHCPKFLLERNALEQCLLDISLIGDVTVWTLS